MQGQLLGIDYDLLITLLGLLIAGLAAIIGIWVERDPNRPPRYAIWLSGLIALATGVGMFQTYDDDQDQKKVEADLARVLQQLDKIANTSEVDIPALNDLLKSELAAQSRANPEVVKSFAQRVADEGGDPAEVVSTYLPEAEVQGMQRKGTLAVKPAKAPAKPIATAEAAEAAPATPDGAEVATRSYTRRRKITFGGGPARLREGGETAEVKQTGKVEEKKDPAAPPPAETAAPAASEAKVDEPAEDKEKLRIGGLKGAGADGDKLRLGGLKGLGGATATPAAGGGLRPPTPAPTGAAGGPPKVGGLKLKH